QHQPVRIERLIQALSDLKLGCVDASRTEGIFSYEQNGVVYYSIQEAGDAFAGRRLKVAHRIGGENEKTCERLSKDLPAVLESLYGSSIPPEDLKKKELMPDEFDVALSYAGEQRDY